MGITVTGGDHANKRGEYIGRFINKWRERTVAVYEHKYNPEMLITVGKSFDGTKTTICEEKKSEWVSCLAKIKNAADHGGTYVYE